MERYIIYGEMDILNTIQDYQALAFFARAKCFKNDEINPYEMLFYETPESYNTMTQLDKGVTKYSTLSFATNNGFTSLEKIENRLASSTNWYVALNKSKVVYYEYFETKEYELEKVQKAIDFSKSPIFIELELNLDNNVVKVMAELRYAISVLGVDLIKSFVGEQLLLKSLAEPLGLKSEIDIQDTSLPYENAKAIVKLAHDNNLKISNDLTDAVVDGELMTLTVAKNATTLSELVKNTIRRLKNFELYPTIKPIKFKDTVFSSDGEREGTMEEILIYCELKNV